MPDETSAATQVQHRILDTDARLEAIERLTNGLGDRDPFLLVAGEAGTGKTSLVRDVVARWGERAVVTFVASTAMTCKEFLEHIVRRCNLEPPPDANKALLIDLFESHLVESKGNGRVPVIVVDDAHELPIDLLGELRLLISATELTRRPLEILLVGLPILEARLAEPALEAVRQRIAVRCRTRPFDQPETRRYLREVVGPTIPEGPGFLPRKTSREIFKRTRGVPRAIHALTAEAIRHARASGADAVMPEHLDIAEAGLRVAPTHDSVVEIAASRASSRQPDGLRESSVPAGSTIAPTREPSTSPVTPTAGSQQSSRDDSRVREWMARFKNPDEPPFVSLLMRSPPDEGFSETLSEPNSDAAGSAAGAGSMANAIAAPSTREGSRGRHRERPRRLASHGPRGRRIPALTATLVILMAVAAIIVLPRARRPEGRGRILAAETHPDVRPSQTPVMNRSAVPRSKEAPAGATEVQPPPSPPPLPTVARSADTTATAPQRFALDIGDYLNSDRAVEERDRVTAETALPGLVLVEHHDGYESYRLVFGVFKSRERAQASADTLIQNGAVREALVIPLSPRHRRQ